MKALQLFEALTRIDELRVRYQSPNSTEYNIIVHGGNVWLMSYDDDEMGEEVLQDIEKNTGIEADSSHSFQDGAEDRPDIFVGMYDSSSNSIYYTDRELKPHPISSPMLKQLAAQFNVSAITANVAGWEGDDAEVDYYRHQMQGKMPETMYHGTNTTHINKISRYGLDPNVEDGNWDAVGKFPLVYLTAEFATASFHANRGAADGRSASGYGGSSPLILKVNVPDPAQFVPDFDVANEMLDDDELADELGYTGSGSWGDHRRDTAAEVQKYSKGIDPIAHSGLAGYRKRIPAKFIEAIYANFSKEGATLPPNESSSDLTKFDNWDEFMSAWEIVQNYGHWYEGIEDEIAEQEEEGEDY